MSDEKKPTAKELTIPQTLTNLRSCPPPRNERHDRIRANAKTPNWSFWKYMPEVETWQACALALNIDPDSLERPEQELFYPPSDGFLTRSFPSDEAAANFEKLLRLLHANRESQHFTHAYNVHDPVHLCEFAAWCAPVVRGMTGHDIPSKLAELAKAAPQAAPAAKVEAVPEMQSEPPKPWLIADPADPEPIYPWYTPARYFARQLVIGDSTLLTKRALLAEKIVQSLTNAGIYKRGGKKKFDPGTVLKALANVSLG